MSSYIETAKQNIRKISETLHAMEAKDMRYGLVCYRDHPPQDSTYATKVFPLTSSISQMQKNIDTMSAKGGGDGPESVACALDAALNADWRKSSVKVCVVIADAPPHGLGESSDGFPQGCPCGIDPLVTARKMAEKNIILYCVACEPNLGFYRNAQGFYKGIADLTSGRYLSLGQAHLLPNVIVGGSAEELDLKKIEEEVNKEFTNVTSAAPALSRAEVEEKVWSNVASRGVATWQLDVTHQPENIANASVFAKATSLSEAVNSPALSPPAPVDFSFSSSVASVPFSPVMPSPAPSYVSQSAAYYQAPVSRSQVSKVLSRHAYKDS